MSETVHDQQGSVLTPRGDAPVGGRPEPLIGTGSTPAETVSTAPSRPGRPNPDWGAPVLVWGVWAALLAAVLVFIGEYGVNAPGYDEWHWVPVMTGECPLTAVGLLEKFSEHRHPLTRLTLFAASRLTGCDFRACMYLSAFLLGGLAGALIFTARRLRGRTSYSDLFFPLALLHFGHAENLLQGWNSNQVVAACLACLVLLVIARNRQPPFAAALLAGGCLLLLPMCGAYGLALVPALALWLAGSGVLMRGSREIGARRNGLLVLGLGIVALLAVPFYLLPSLPGIYQELNDIPTPSGSVRAALRGSGEFLASSFGIGLGEKPSLLWTLAGSGVVALSLCGVVVLVVVGWRQPQEHYRASGFLFFLGAMACLTLGVGYGRGAEPGGGFLSRYTISAVPVLCALYLIAVVYSPAAGGRLVQIGLLLLMCVFFRDNWQAGTTVGDTIYAQKQALLADVQAGMIAGQLAQRHTATLNPSWSGKVFPELVEQTEAGIRALGRARVGEFKDLREDPLSREVPFPLVPVAEHRPAELNDITWEEKGGGGAGKVEGDKPYLVWELQKPQRVHAIRIRYAYDKSGSRANFRMAWSKDGEKESSEEVGNVALALKAGAGEGTVTVWVNDVINSFRIDPHDEPCVFRIAAITLLLPAEEASARAHPKDVRPESERSFQG